MSRKHHDDQEFGSDSFLDVLANLVGILIILIVVVGVRVAKLPPSERELQAAGAAAAPAPAPVEVAVEPAPATPLPPIPKFAPLPAIEPTEAMMTQARQLKQQHETLVSQVSSLDAQRQELAQQQQRLEAEAAALRKEMSQKAEVLQSEKSQLSTLESDVSQLRSQVLALQQQAEAISAEEAPVEKLTHQLPPIGRVVTGDEVHFRLQNNRVSRVPVAALAKEVQLEIQRRKEVLLNRSFFQGATRPIEGYLMEFVLQRQEMSLQDELRYGRGIVRVGVSGWVIRPTGPLFTETEDEAMRPGSTFQQSLAAHGPTATVTFWVYPDSFDIHQKLKAFAHDAGYWVASRPLPTGVPIAGSPQGSKSVAQ